ncbi:MAG TPA: hypothetical protein VMO80_17290 [Terriglobales bacterium]|nr:hypothetical protein [Terriglobales bacterium]
MKMFIGVGRSEPPAIGEDVVRPEFIADIVFRQDVAIEIDVLGGGGTHFLGHAAAMRVISKKKQNQRPHT